MSYPKCDQCMVERTLVEKNMKRTIASGLCPALQKNSGLEDDEIMEK